MSKPDTAEGEMGHERILHRWNIETTGTACGDFNAQHITTDLDKVNCDGCKPLASLPEPLSCDNASGQEVVNVPSSVPREPEGSRGLQCNCTLIAGAHTYADCVPLLNERTKRWNDQQGEGYSLAPREESARTEDSAAIQARSTFEVDPYDESESLVYACNLLDVAKQDWGVEWTEHDERVRAGLSAMITRRAQQPTPPSTAAGGGRLTIEDIEAIRDAALTEDNQESFDRDVADICELALPHLRDRERWKPFDTAPADGTNILVYRKDSGVFIASFTPSPGDAGEHGEQMNGEECWFGCYGDDLTGDLPTHWRPLPKGAETT